MNKQVDADWARNQMARRFEGGERQQRELIDQVAKTVIVDKLVHPRAMDFVPGNSSKDNQLRLQYLKGEGNFSLHRHALGQFCQKVRLPMNFVNMLLGSDPWKLVLVSHNLNELFHQSEWKDRNGEPLKFLHRIVGNEVRGFLSRRFNRYLASAPMLYAFTEACRKNDAKAVEASSSSVRYGLKALMPDVFEAFPGEYVGIGTEWANSDFGSGKLTVSQTVWRVSTGTSTVLDDSLSRVHLGSIIEDSELEMSDETYQKEVEAITSAIHDTVKQQLSAKHVERVLATIRAAHDQQIPWTKLKGRLGKFLNKKDIDWLQKALDTSESGIIDLPPVSFTPTGERIPNNWWAASAISAIAASETEEDRRSELQKEAGKFLAELWEDEEDGP